MGDLFIAEDVPELECPALLPILVLIVALLAYPFVQMTLNAYWRHAGTSAASAPTMAAPT